MPKEYWNFIIPGEPVPKSTMKPPRGKNAYWVVQNVDKYKPLRKTWEYQALVKDSAIAAQLPAFGPNDPLELSASIYKRRHGMGDTKNIVAAIEDGLQFANVIPNDRQITSYGNIRQWFMAGEHAHVHVYLRIEPNIIDPEWLLGWFSGSKKNMKEWLEEHEVGHVFQDRG